MRARRLHETAISTERAPHASTVTPPTDRSIEPSTAPRRSAERFAQIRWQMAALRNEWIDLGCVNGDAQGLLRPETEEAFPEERIAQQEAA